MALGIFSDDARGQDFFLSSQVAPSFLDGSSLLSRVAAACNFFASCDTSSTPEPPGPSGQSSSSAQ